MLWSVIDYTVASGSTIITLLPSYLKTLEPGAYEVALTYSGGKSVGAGYLRDEIVIKAASEPIGPGTTKPSETTKPSDMTKKTEVTTKLTPTETVKTTVSTTTTKQGALPKTGEKITTPLLAILFLTARASLISIRIYRKRKDQE